MSLSGVSIGGGVVVAGGAVVKNVSSHMIIG